MTIKIEREALQCITNDTSECILPSLEEQPVDRLPELSFNKGLDYPELDLTECDDSSVSSYSFTSSTAERTVSWATPLVVEVRTRPRTKAMDVRQLFYSYEETLRMSPISYPRRILVLRVPGFLASTLLLMLWHRGIMCPTHVAEPPGSTVSHALL